MKTRRTCALLLALVLSLSLCGCGASSSSPAMREQSSATAGYVPEPAPMMMNAAYDMAFEDGGFGMMASAKTESKVGGGEKAPEENPEKIIYSGDATVETTEFERALRPWRR